MSENSTQSQFYGWGMTFNMLRKIPAIKNRIFNTYDNMMDYLNDVNGSAIEGLLLTVVKDGDNNGVYFVEKIKKDENDSLSSVIKLSNETNIITNNDKYLTITALEDDLTVSLSRNPCQYSLDGTEWINLDASTSTPAINSGEKIYFKAEGLTPIGRGGIGTFTVSKRFNLSGTVMSMLFGDEAEGKTDLTGYDYAFSDLFMRCTGLEKVSENFLPATELASSCYNEMFKGCTSLVTAPELPATSLTDGCYCSMFAGCTSLVTAPKLPATTLADVCYSGMFQGCESLVQAPALPATTLTDSCYNDMFYGCTSLVNAPALPATTLAENCYRTMFLGCTSLINAPALPATTLAENCYVGMFYNCTSLVTAPALPATTLADGCYSRVISGEWLGMFAGCTSLVTAPPELPATTLVDGCYRSMFKGCKLLLQAPELPATTLTNACYSNMFQGCKLLLQAPALPATTLADYCYDNMFQGCTSLNYIKMLATDISANSCLRNWVNGASLTGTFVRSENATWIETGDNGIPEGWNILPYTPLTITALEDGTEISFSNNCEFSLDNKKWRLYTKNTKISISNEGKVYFRGNLKNESVNVGIGTFTISKPFNLSGNVMSMLFNDEIYGETDLTGYEGCFTKLFYNTPVVNVSPTFLPATILASGCYRSMFEGCTSLETAPEFPTTALANYCYQGMFKGCTSLVIAPELPATELASSCYESMFYGCTSLSMVPLLPATTLADGCYRNMFYDCTLLNTIPSNFLPATTLEISCYESMFQGCTSLVTMPPELPATTLAERCYFSMFQGCTSLVTIPSDFLPATTLADYCYGSMFYGCTSLTRVPLLPATTLADYCYQSMFQGCTSLTNAPELPATTLADYCYQSMFLGCTSLTNAPELPATELTSGCYDSMFQGCTSLNRIKMMASDINFTDLAGTYFYKSTQNWVSEVSLTGTFVMSKDATWSYEKHRGVNGIPKEWKVETA